MIKPISKAVDENSRARGLGTKLKFENNYDLATEIGDAVIIPEYPAGAWDLTNAKDWITSGSKSFDFVVTNNYGMFMSPDGTKLFILKLDNDTIFSYTLSVAHDVSTAIWDGVSFYVGGQESIPTKVFFKPDGTKMYVCGDGTDNAYQYALSTPWDITTAVYETKSIAFSINETGLQSMAFSGNGSACYSIGQQADTIYQWSLPTAWDFTGATYTGKNFPAGGVAVLPTGMYMHPDGSRMWVLDQSQKRIYQFTLTVTNDISTAFWDGVSFYVGGEDISPQDVYFRSNGAGVYISAVTSRKIYQYEIYL